MPKVVPSVEGAAQKYLLTEENAPKDALRSTRVALGELKQYDNGQGTRKKAKLTDGNALTAEVVRAKAGLHQRIPEFGMVRPMAPPRPALAPTSRRSPAPGRFAALR